VVSPVEYNRKTRLAISCPVTSRSKGHPFEVEIPEGCPIDGVILADQVRSLDCEAREAEFICALPARCVVEVLGRLRLLQRRASNANERLPNHRVIQASPGKYVMTTGGKDTSAGDLETPGQAGKRSVDSAG
jgi:mRNA interferase MazF